MKLIVHCLLFFSLSVKAEVLLKDIGIIGLMSHDIFAWNHKTEVNTENGRLDLSTIFDFDNGSRWEKGGNPKNGENSPVYTITMKLLNYYKSELKKSDSKIARQKTVLLFHHMIKESFVRLSGLPFPETGLSEKVTNTEQAALRGMHDILPGRVKLFGRLLRKELVLTNAFTAKLKLNEAELNQKITYFNGDYDEEYKHIKIPFTKKVINLKEVDAKFIEKFSPYKQAEMLDALKKVGLGEKNLQDVFFMHNLSDLVSKAICPTGNEWMPQDIVCL
jgi:hypothetical protein